MLLMQLGYGSMAKVTAKCRLQSPTHRVLLFTLETLGGGADQSRVSANSEGTEAGDRCVSFSRHISQNEYCVMIKTFIKILIHCQRSAVTKTQSPWDKSWAFT